MQDNRVMRRRAIRTLAVVIGTAFFVLSVEFVCDWSWWSRGTSAGRLMSVELPPIRMMLCVDLLPELQQAPAGDVDRAFDRWHFGPKINRRIAASLIRKVADALLN